MSLETLYQQALTFSPWELVAVVLAIAYLVLAVKENIACWYAAFVSTLIFLAIFWEVNLYMESGLQVYYLGMAMYGWYQWQQPGPSLQSGPELKEKADPLLTGSSLPITTWSIQQHCLTLGLILALSIGSGVLLEATTDARLPFLDSLTTWGAVVTTYMVTKKVLENWIYWFFIDGLSIYLYLDRELYLTALLFGVYIVIIFFGYYSWLNHYRRQENPDQETSGN